MADELGAQTVAFPAVSAGIYGWPLADAAHIALSTVQGTPTRVREARFVLFSDATLNVFHTELEAGSRHCGIATYPAIPQCRLVVIITPYRVPAEVGSPDGRGKSSGLIMFIGPISGFVTAGTVNANRRLQDLVACHICGVHTVTDPLLSVTKTVHNDR